ncbi:MAG: hypothetical protein ACXVC6_15260 [Bacteroidia bacterium]
MKNICRIPIASVMIAFCGCKALSPTISAYDNYSYMQTISLKVGALNLMDMATEAKQLSPADFKDLVQEKNELLAMVALKQAGVAALQLDKFKDA